MSDLSDAEARVDEESCEAESDGNEIDESVGMKLENGNHVEYCGTQGNPNSHLFMYP